MELKSKPNTSSENKQHNKLIKKLNENPEDLTDEEMDLFLSSMREESDANMMKHYNPHR